MGIGFTCLLPQLGGMRTTPKLLLNARELQSLVRVVPGKCGQRVATLPRMHRVGAVLIGVACAVAAIGTADAATSPQALRSAILRAALAKHSVHYVSVGTVLGARTKTVGDVARNRGIQRVTYVRKGKTGHVTIRVVGSTAYVRGDAVALSGYMHLPKSFASRHAGQWISIPHASPIYRFATVDLTFGSFIGDNVPAQRLTVVRAKVGGKKVRGLRGTARGRSGTVTVFVPLKGRPLPVAGKDVVRGSFPAAGRVRMSHWNEPVRVAAPAHAVPLHG
jgi:hypothetical protein